MAGRLRAAGCVFADDEADLLLAEIRDAVALDAAIGRRIAGEPLEQIVGWAAFCGLHLAVAPGVFVPRRRTELLVRQALAVLEPGDVVLDLCCGVGAVAAALAAARRSLQVYAADIDPAAVDCARRNLAVGDPGADDSGSQVFVGDLFAALPDRLLGRIDVVCANAPYVPSGAIATMPAEARDHEARAALDGGGDGLDVQRRIAEAAPAWLAPGGRLLVETSRRQANASAGILQREGFSTRIVHDDDVDGTVVVGYR